MSRLKGACAVLVLLGLVSVAHAEEPDLSAACNPNKNPHSFACQQLAWDGKAGFPLLKITPNSIREEWFAATYASIAGQPDGAFRMDVDPNDPKRPGKGVLNVRSDGQTNVVGSVFIRNGQMSWNNFHGQRLSSGNLRQLDAGTVIADATDNGQPIRFECRVFVRENANHLTCQFFYLKDHGTENAKWTMIGYFGFVTRASWDSFVNHRGDVIDVPGPQPQPEPPQPSGPICLNCN